MKCEIADCKEKAAKVIREEDLIVYLCEKHFNEIQAEVEVRRKIIDSMTEEELIERLEELNGKKVIH